MKKTALFIIAALLFLVCLPAFAASQFPDVPADHWAYAAVQDLMDKGLMEAYPDGTFGGKRAFTRYEFAQILSKAIPEIAKRAVGHSAGTPGPQGPVGPQGIAGANGIGLDQIQNIQRLLEEFKVELAAQNVDVQALKKGISVLGDRVSAVEAEQARVKITAEASFTARGEVTNSGKVIDRDGVKLVRGTNVLQHSTFFHDFDLGIKGKVSDTATVTAVINAGNYLPFALNSSKADDFTLWNLYLNSAVKLGPLGAGQVTVGRFPFQLTPLTLKFINPDSYTYSSKLDTGDYVFDGATMSFSAFGKANVTAFATKSVSGLGLEVPYSNVAGTIIDQIAGARAVIGTPFAGNLGLTYYVAAPESKNGRMQVYGADYKATIAKVGIGAEYAQTKPSDGFSTAAPDTKNDAWNANLSYKIGKLNIGGGYTEVGENYAAPGYWSRMGRAINLENVKGEVANISYALTPKIVLCADGSFLKPKESKDGVSYTEATDAGATVAHVDKINGFKAGVKYALTAANSIDLGWEQNQWKAVTGFGGTAKENYYTIGFGHTFNTNASMKVLYQIEDYKTGGTGFDPFTGGSYRGGVASAQFLLKY